MDVPLYLFYAAISPSGLIRDLFVGIFIAEDAQVVDPSHTDELRDRN